jgi:hypothetical protein
MEHITEDDLELYSMGRLVGAQLEQVEEHLLVCQGCQERLLETDEFIAAFRAAVKEKPLAHSQSETSGPGLLRRFLAGWQSWKPAYGLAGVLAVMVLATLLYWPRTADGPVQDVYLHAVRNAEVTTVSSGAVLKLHLDMTQLPERSSFYVRLVDAAGREVWETEVTPQSGWLSAGLIPQGRLSAGRYWIRVYPSPASTELLREYGLLVR